MPLQQHRTSSRSSSRSRQAVTVQPSVPTMNFSISPPLYNGRDGSFSRFKSDFDIFAQINSWTDQDKLLYLPLCLTGLARDAYEALDHSQRLSFSAAVDALRHSFAPVGVVEAHSRLQALKFECAEALEAFLIRFKAAVRAAFPNDATDPLLLTYFLGCLPPDLRAGVIGAGCDTFQQAISKTRCLLAARRVTSQPLEAGIGDAAVRRVEEPGVLSQLLSRLEALESKVDGALRAPRPSAAPGPSGPCFACGRNGHTRADCRYGSATCHACGKKGHIKPVCRSKNVRAGGRSESFTAPASSGGQMQ